MGRYNKRGYLNSDFKIFHLTDQISTEFEFHYHEFHKITIFISGNVQYFVEGKTYPLQPYDIVLVNRNDIHRVQVDPYFPMNGSSSIFLPVLLMPTGLMTMIFPIVLKKQKKNIPMCYAFILLKKALFSRSRTAWNVLFLIRNMPAVCTDRSYFWNL